MECLTVFNVKVNVMRVQYLQLLVYLVMELIGFHGLHPIMIARKYFIINFSFFFYKLFLILIILF